MLTKTLNTVVRDALIDNGLPIHYYMTFSHHAKRCLESLALDFNLGGNVKESKIVVNSYNRVAIPAEAIQIIGVYGIFGGERRNFKRNDQLTKAYKLDGITKMPWLEDDTSFPDNQLGESSTLLDKTIPNEYPTVFYPTNEVDYEFSVDEANSEIILGPRAEMDDVYVWYLSSLVSISSANVVSYIAIPSIISYIDWMVYKASGTAQSRIMEKKDDYYNEKRLLRGRLNNLNTSDLYEIFAMN